MSCRIRGKSSAVKGEAEEEEMAFSWFGRSVGRPSQLLFSSPSPFSFMHANDGDNTDTSTMMAINPEGGEARVESLVCGGKREKRRLTQVEQRKEEEGGGDNCLLAAADRRNDGKDPSLSHPPSYFPPAAGTAV